MALVLDTGPLYASLDRNDHAHAACRCLIIDTIETLVIPSPVLVEVDQLVYARLSGDVFDLLLTGIEHGTYHIDDLGTSDYTRIRALCRQYADSDIGFVDAAVLAIVERLNEPKLATLDHRHFRMLRPRHVDPLQLLPER